jgi:glycosyltransferase involved in cell wall biosynthesis
MLADVYKPHVSGITNYIALNKEHLESRGHEVFVFAFGDESYRDVEPNVIRSPGLPILSTGYYISLSYNLQARKLLRSMDVVHVHHPFVSGSLALRYCRPRGIPIVFTNHTRYDLYAHVYMPGLPVVIGETALEAYLTHFCRSCDLVISPSAGMRDVLLSFGVDAPVEIVPNGVNLAPFRHATQPESRSSFGIQDEDVLLIYVGRLGPEKNLPFLLRSFAGAAEAYGNISLMLVGDGPERDNLQDRVVHMGIDERVYFAGLIPYEQLPGYLAMADAFVTASVTEVHPLSVIEALAAGLPVLGVASPGVGDTIRDGFNGLLSRQADLASFTAKMIRLVTDRSLRGQLAAAASDSANQYSVELTTEIMVSHYSAVIENSEERRRKLRARLVRLADGWRRS